MNYLQLFLIGFVALIHLYILYIELFLWNKPKGIKTFGLKSQEFANDTKVMGANQGLYNGFLAAGLLWSLVSQKTDVALFFLGCVFVAGVFGAYSTKKIRILYIQTIPAFLGILALFF